MMKERGEIAKEDRIFGFKDIRQALASACRRAGLPRFGHHALRHFFCSNAIEAGVDFKAIAGWLGHKDGGVLAAKTYGHLRNEHSAAMAKRMTFDADAQSELPNVIRMS
jgi:site-specific recombinase XerD